MSVRITGKYARAGDVQSGLAVGYTAFSSARTSCGAAICVKHCGCRKGKFSATPPDRTAASLPSVLLLRAVQLNLELAEVRRAHWVPLQLILEARPDAQHHLSLNRFESLIERDTVYRVFWFERGRPVHERLRRLVPIPMFLGHQPTFDGVSRIRENFSDYLVQFRRLREGVWRVVQNLWNGGSVVRHDLRSVSAPAAIQHFLCGCEADFISFENRA